MKHLNLLQTSLQQDSEAASNQVMQWMQDLGLGGQAAAIVGGILVLIVGFFIAKLISRFVGKIIRKTGVDDKLKGSMKISTFVGKLLYFLIMLLVLMTALDIMGVGNQVMEPLNTMLSKFSNAIPNIIIAGIIIYVGYFLAKIVSEFIEFSADSINALVPKLKLPEGTNLVNIAKTIIFILIFVPILIVGLDFLNFDAITKPATGLLEQFMNAIPLILKAAAVMLIAVFGGKFITGLLKDLMTNMNIDSFSEKLGIQNVIGNNTLSGIIASLVLIFIIYSGVMESLNILGLDQLSNVLYEVMHVAGKVVFGLLILVLGNIVANFAVGLFKGENTNNFTLAIMKGAIITIFLAMGLSTMDIADSIINLAFGLALGAIAVAFALSFGLGGKDVAGQEMKKLFEKLNKKD